MKIRSIAFVVLLNCAALGSLLAALETASFRLLHAFSGLDGDEPTSLLQTNDGTLWGVTFLGGSTGLGSGLLYKIDRGGIFSVVHTFTDSPDGSFPGKLIQARDGTIYGLTSSGGTKFGGTIYHIDLAGNYSVLHSFNPTIEGSGPSSLIESTDGFFYGTASDSGNPDSACPNHHAQGTLFRMDPAGRVTPLHTFCESIDGSIPNSLVEATDGFLYGICKQDGPFGLGFGAGTFWKSDKAGDVTVLHIFGPKTLNGDEPTSPNGIVQAANGLFYGVANSGGLSSQGAIFRADAEGHVVTIHSFDAFATNGSDPESNFVLAGDGFFYGTASQGGLPVDDFNRTGVVYKADTSGHVWVLHTFVGQEGGNPVATPFLDRRGKFLYATAIFQGPANHGTTSALPLKPNLPIIGLSFNPNPVKGGQSSVATIRLAKPAGSSGQVVNLFGNGPLTLPETVTVPAGQISATFTVNTDPVSVGFDASVTAYLVSIGMSAPLTLVP